MNEDFRLRPDFPHHRKTRRLINLCGAEGVLNFLELLGYVTHYRPDGDLSGMSVDDIEMSSMWEGPEGEFVKALIKAGFIDGEEMSYRIHDWSDHNPYQAKAQERSDIARANAKKRWDKRKEYATKNATAMQTDSTAMQTDSTAMQTDANCIKNLRSDFENFMIALIEEYNRSLPMCRKMDFQFLGQEPLWVKEIWKVFPESHGLPFWIELFEEVKKSDDWLISRASFPFLITLERVKEIKAGKYQKVDKKSKSQKIFESNMQSLSDWVPPEERIKNATVS